MRGKSRETLSLMSMVNSQSIVYFSHTLSPYLLPLRADRGDPSNSTTPAKEAATLEDCGGTFKIPLFCQSEVNRVHIRKKHASLSQAKPRK